MEKLIGKPWQAKSRIYRVKYYAGIIIIIIKITPQWTNLLTMR